VSEAERLRNQRRNDEHLRTLSVEELVGEVNKACLAWDVLWSTAEDRRVRLDVMRAEIEELRSMLDQLFWASADGPDPLCPGPDDRARGSRIEAAMLRIQGPSDPLRLRAAGAGDVSKRPPASRPAHAAGSVGIGSDEHPTDRPSEPSEARKPPQSQGEPDGRT
jgi:hypothetical protein